VSDFSSEWPTPDGGPSGDLGVDASGDFLVVDGDQETRQRLTRRLLTNARSVLPDSSILPPDNIFDVNYGAGLRRMVGAAVGPSNAVTVRQICVDCALQEDTIATNPPPSAAVQSLPAGFAVAVTYTSIVTGRPVSTPRISLS